MSINDTKQIHCSAGPRSNLVHATVQLNGVLPSEQLTPKLAARAARVAFGHRDGVTVWDNEHGHGYRLYAKSARKLAES